MIMNLTVLNIEVSVMKKLIFIFLSLFILIPNVYSLSNIELYSPNYVIYDLTEDEVITSSDMDKEISIASLTKIMTTITAINLIDNLDESITITSDVFNGLPYDASVAGLKVGDVVTYRDLLYASILPSGADATQALAINLSGSIDNFVKLMNELSDSIGMSNSNFINVTGLDIKNHYSTLNDLIILLKYSLSNDLFKTIYSTKEYTLTNGLKVESTVNLYNRKLKLDTSRILGSKTGFTDEAGVCISFYFDSNSHEFIGITTGATRSNTSAYNILDALNMIDYMDNNYNQVLLIRKDNVIKNVDVKLSTIEKYSIKNNQDYYMYLPVDYSINDLRIEYDGVEILDYTYESGDKIGVVNYYYQDKYLYSMDVILDVDIQINLCKVIIKNKLYIILGVIIVILSTYIINRRVKKV